MITPIVSIVICTHKRINLLRLAVNSLAKQTALSERFEVIVVDNDVVPSARIKDMVLEAARVIDINCLHEKKIGLSHARNLGGGGSQGEYVCYLDDDANVFPHYVKTLLAVIENQEPDIIGGPYIPFYLNAKPRWYQDRYGSGRRGNEARYLTSNEYLFGGNIIFKRNLLDDLGWFDPNLGMSGGKLWYGEETMLMIKAWKAHPDLKVYYHPDLLVRHHVPARKMSAGYQVKTQFLKGKAQAYFWMPESEWPDAQRKALLVLVRSLLAILLKTLPQLIFRDRRQYPHWQNYVYERTAQRMYTLGSQVRLAADRFRSLE